MNPLVQERKNYTVEGGKILIFGDLHFSSNYEGKHKNYINDCYTTMSLIMDHVKEQNPSAIFFLGDLCGVNERSIKDRPFLTRVLMFFASLYGITKGNVYSVKGNHEMGDFSDFDMLISLGYIKNPKYVDYAVDGNVEVRFHFVNYGDEAKKLSIKEDYTSNVVLGHNDYYIDGVTPWFSGKGAVELTKLANFNGVEMVIPGHIHMPTHEILYTNLPNGESVGLYYVGSPSRVAERFDDCDFLMFSYSDESSSVEYGAYAMGLPPARDVFYEDEVFKNSEGGEEYEEEETEEEKHTKALDLIVKEIMGSRIVTGDLFKQIDIIPGNEKEREIAKEYLRKAMEVG